MSVRLSAPGGAALAAVALLLAGCRWGASAPLIAGSHADPSPLAAGDYEWAADRQYYYSVQGGGTEPVIAAFFGSDGVTEYRLRFDRIDDAFYLVEATSGDEIGVAYGLVRLRPEGFDQVALSCSDGADGQIALAAGAARGRDKACMFSSYESLRRAAVGVAELVRRGNGLFSVTSYKAR
jgi:hypothetical protein